MECISIAIILILTVHLNKQPLREIGRTVSIVRCLKTQGNFFHLKYSHAQINLLI